APEPFQLARIGPGLPEARPADGEFANDGELQVVGIVDDGCDGHCYSLCGSVSMSSSWRPRSCQRPSNCVRSTRARWMSSGLVRTWRARPRDSLVTRPASCRIATCL